MHIVPARMRYLKARFVWKPPNIDIEYAHAVRIIFFGMAAHQLHTHAGTQHRLFQGWNQFIQAPLAQVRHGSTGFAHARKNDLIGRTDFSFIIGKQITGSQSFQCIHNRLNIARVVFDNDSFHT